MGPPARPDTRGGRHALKVTDPPMPGSIAADAVLIVHFAFVVFVIAGGALVFLWPRLAWLHLPAVFWGTLVELTGWVCPLTPLENALRHAAGDAGYGGDFIQHYIVALLYPEGLTRGTQILFGLAVVALNVLCYAALVLQARRHATTPAD